MGVEDIEVVVVGGGQAGLSVSHELSAHGVEHVVLERGRVAQTWRGRWDSFCLVTPNWSWRLPGGEYSGDDPDGYLARDGIVALLEEYAQSFTAPLREGVAVNSLESSDDGGFLLHTSAGDIRARTVVLCTGAYQRPHRPAAAAELPAGVLQLDAEGYTSPAALPPGAVLIVGSGQTGCQLAEELHQDGRQVFLACGRAPWAPRRVNGKDIFHWLVDTGNLEQTMASLPSPAARLIATVVTTGHDGGHDLHHRTLQRLGVTLFGRLRGATDGRAWFATDLAESVAFGDARYRDLRDWFAKSCKARGVDMPDMPDPEPFAADPPESLDLASVSAVIFTTGFRPDYTSWVQIDGFDGMGFPLQQDGASTACPGLYYCGVHFLRKRKSSLLYGVGEDAALVAASIAAQRGAAAVV